MKNQWQSVSFEQAKKHELYGIRGWLAWFAAAAPIGILGDFGNLYGAAASAGLTIGEFFSLVNPLIALIKTIFIVEITITALIYFLLLTKNKNFRVWSSVLMLSRFPVIVIAASMYTFTGLPELVGNSVIPWAVSCAVWVTYLQCSQRVRVTFEHSIKASAQTSGRQEPIEDVYQNRANYLTPKERRKTSYREPVEERLLPRQDAKSTTTTEMDNLVLSLETEETFWEKASNEINTVSVRPGLWAKCFSEAEGNESLAKANYMKHRVAQFTSEWTKEQIVKADLLKSEHEHHRYIASLSAADKEIYEALEVISGKNDDSFGAVTKLIGLLGGSAKWESSGFLRPKWIVHFESITHTFDSDEELKSWAEKNIVATATNRISPEVHRDSMQLNDSDFPTDLNWQDGVVYEKVDNVAETLNNKIAQFELNGSYSFSALISLIRILGGDAKWDINRKKWFVKHDGQGHQFFDEKELKTWGAEKILPYAKQAASRMTGAT